MAWVYTVVLATCSAGILATGVVLTRRLFRDETPAEAVATGRADAEGAEGTAP